MYIDIFSKINIISGSPLGSYALMRRMSLQIMEYAEQRIPVLNEFCVVCDEPHVFENGPMLRVSNQEETSSLYFNVFEFDKSNG